MSRSVDINSAAVNLSSALLLGFGIIDALQGEVWLVNAASVPVLHRQ